MTYKELHDKIKSGEIKLPITVKINEPLWEEFELDAGCKAKLTHIRPTRDIGELKLYFDFSKFEEYNKNFWTHDYYDDNHNPTLAIYETKKYEKLEGKCDCYVENSCDVQFTLEPTEVIIFESIIGRHVNNGKYSGVGEIVGKPFTTSHIGKKVKVTVEFLEV
jgi:hypothetical protein